MKLIKTLGEELLRHLAYKSYELLDNNMSDSRAAAKYAAKYRHFKEITDGS